MIRKTVRIFKRFARSWDRRSSTDTHVESVVRETWWLLWIIPLYSRDDVRTSKL